MEVLENIVKDFVRNILKFHIFDDSDDINVTGVEDVAAKVYLNISSKNSIAYLI